MSIERYSVFARTALSAAAIVVMAAPALAQNTTAGIAGRVTDAAGNLAAGANGGGAARRVALGQPGRSPTPMAATRPVACAWAARSITITKGGQTEKRDNVFLSLAETLAFDAQLGVHRHGGRHRAKQCQFNTGVCRPAPTSAAASSMPWPRSSATSKTTPAPTRGCRRPTRSAARSPPAARTAATTRSPSTASTSATPSASSRTTCPR